jgi:hypothetical protein
MDFERPDFLDLVAGDFAAVPAACDVFELKFDGNWGQVVFDGLTWTIWSRNGLIQDSGMLPFGVGPHTVLHGEHIRGTEWAKDHPDLYGKVAIFGATSVLGQDTTKIPANEVRDRIKFFIERYRGKCPIFDRCFLVDQIPVASAREAWDRFIVNGDYEGLVFKNSKASWGEDFARMKKEVTFDYVVLGFLESDSDTYSGWGVASIIGGLYINGVLERRCKVSGLTAELRKEFFDHPDKYVGRVFEAKGKKLSKKGALRHPNFIRFRDDKSPEDCKWT